MSRTTRDPRLRQLYLQSALADVPRLLGAIDRNPLRATYGCLDREYWHYRTGSFPSAMFQEGALALALVHATPLPGNRWHAQPRVRDLAVAAVDFAARSSHPDGSCDDYYPFERALGAAVFSLHAAARTCRILDLRNPPLLSWLQRRADWILRHGESGRLSNHHALAALGLWHVGLATGHDRYCDAARHKLQTLLDTQHAEGWFEEYGGADPGYQTLTIDCLAKLRREMSEPRLAESLRRAVAFARCFLHPDGSYGGPYGSRGTRHFFAHGMELLASEDPNAADLADGYLSALSQGRQAHFTDDRLYAHHTANRLEAYLDWSAERAASQEVSGKETRRFFAGAGLLVRRLGNCQTIVSSARGGAFCHFSLSQTVHADAGLIVQAADGRLAVSNMHDLGRRVRVDLEAGTLSVEADLHWVRFETATPSRQALLHLGMVTLGRFCRTWVRKILQRRLITGRAACPVRLVRRLEILAAKLSDPTTTGDASPPASLRVIDEIVLGDPRVRIAAMYFASDLEPAYVAATNVYQDSVLQPWTDLAAHVETLNRDRRVTIVREF